MFLDVSEIKAFRHCQRQWQLSSRNQFHLRPFVTPKAFALGTVFHNGLHKMYLGKDIEEIDAYVADELSSADPKDATMIRSMLRGYFENVLPGDLDEYLILDIEHKFSFTPRMYLSEFGGLDDLDPDFVDSLCNKDIVIGGSIDMIAFHRPTNAIWGFEHKTAKSFRGEAYLWMDEQPRVYTAALQLFVQKYNLDRMNEWVAAGCPVDREPVPAKLGGVYINEVRKLVKAFDYKRSPLKYSPTDLRNFMLGFLTSCAECHKVANNPRIPRIPRPDFMTCSTCMFNSVCELVKYSDITLDELLKEFNQEFEVRKEDHLSEKESEDL